MRGFSKAIIAGNVTRDPELRTTPNGAQVCSFAIAVNRAYKGNDGSQQEQTSYIDCSAWGKTGEIIAQYIKKGSPFLVSGRLEQRSWDDKTTGQKRSRTEIVVEDFTFIGGGAAAEGGARSYGGGSYGGGSKASAPAAANHAAEDVLPEDVPDGEPINLEDIPF